MSFFRLLFNLFVSIGLLANCANGATRDRSNERVIVDPAELECYLDGESYFPGDPVAMYVHTLASHYSFSLFRLGTKAGPLDVVEGLPGLVQVYAPDAYVRGANWTQTHSYPLPAGLASGLYVFKFVTDIGGNQSNPYFVPFVIKGRKGPGMPSLVVMSNTFTWAAYNYWGGASFYKGSRQVPEDSEVSVINLRRPSDSSCHDSPEGHTGCVEQHIAAFLCANGYPFHQITNLDLHLDPEALLGYKVLVIDTHSEYWSAEMFDRLEGFLKAGGSVLNISGNVLWWKVTLRGDQVECQKFGGTHVQTGEKGGKWQDLGRPSDPLLGVRSDPRGIHTFAAFRVLDSSHWLFKGTGLADGDVIGAAGLNKGGGSGWETDKLGPLAPAGTHLLARGLNPGKGGADIVYLETPAGGAVLSAGSITFPGSLVVDRNLQMLVKHFLDRWR